MGIPLVTSLPPGWLTVTQAAAYFGVGKTTAYRLIEAGEWPTSKLPGMRRSKFSPADIASIEARAARSTVSA